MERLSPLLTDFYQLTMASAYLKSGMAEHTAVFQLFFRTAPFSGTFALACGIHDAVQFIENFYFSKDELDYLRSLCAPDGKRHFDEQFLRYLSKLRLCVDVEAVAEGTPVFAMEPIVRVSGPLLQCQILESTLLNLINFQTLIASKAARVRFAAGDDYVIEFGLRRAQGIDGAMAAARAAFVGGCDATSNVLAGMRLNIPVRGTMAHSFVMAFGDERKAFEAYGQSPPHNNIFLVDTYDTLQGIKNAIDVAIGLRSKGLKFSGIRLDSGKVDELSKTGRVLLDNAGFRDAVIVASGDLDEFEIARLKQNGACIDIWGVGTRLVTGHSDGALGGIYKLGAIADKNSLMPRMKFSNDLQKATFPGLLDTWRLFLQEEMVADVIFSKEMGVSAKSKTNVPQHDNEEVLLKPLIKQGQRIKNLPSLQEVQAFAKKYLKKLPEKCRKLSHPTPYRVDIDDMLLAEVKKYRSDYEGTRRG